MRKRYSLFMFALIILISCSGLFVAEALAGADCSTPTIIPHGDFTYNDNTLGATDDCHYYTFGFDAGDIMYAFTLHVGDAFNCFVTNSSNLIYYVVRDCAEPDATVEDIAFTGTEGIDFYNDTETDMTCYLVIDGYNASSEGSFTLTGFNGGTVAVGESSWDGVKAIYR